MSYNFRPSSVEEIKGLGLTATKEKSMISLFQDMKASFGASHDEFITVDTAAGNLGNTKILNAFEKLIDLEAYKKRYPGLSLKFGEGSKPSSNAPSTQQQETVTLKIFEELLSSRTKNYTKFEQLVPALIEIYPGLPYDKSWYKSFELQFYQIVKETKLPKNNFDIYNRDGGFMDYISKLVNSKFQIVKKDSWDPADIWLLKSSTAAAYEKKLDAATTILEVNSILRAAYNKKEIVGVSLKKNDGKTLHYELVNLKTNDKDLPVDMQKFDLNISYDATKNIFTSVTSKLNIKYDGKIYSMGVKSNQGAIGNITYEFVGSGSAAFLGKVPKDMLQLELAKDGFQMPEHTHFMKFNEQDFKNKVAVVKANKNIFNITGNLDEFINNLKKSWIKGRAKDNTVMSQIFTFAYIIASMPDKRRKEFIKTLFFMSQKKGSLFGPFGKLY